MVVLFPVVLPTRGECVQRNSLDMAVYVSVATCLDLPRARVTTWHDARLT